MSDATNQYKITPEMQSELPLAVRQLLDITEETAENELDWKLKTPKTNANTILEETNVVTKTPVAVQEHVYPETEVGCCICACHTIMHEIKFCIYIRTNMMFYGFFTHNP